MFKSLLYSTAVATFLALSATAALAQTVDPEADREKKDFTNTSFSNDADKGTVILKVNTKDGSMSIMSIDHVPKDDAEAQLLAKTGTFIPVDQSKITSKDAPLTESDKT